MVLLFESIKIRITTLKNEDRSIDVEDGAGVDLLVLNCFESEGTS